MARTPSTMQELGTQAPSFELVEPATGKKIALAQFAGKPVLIAFISNHCPYVIKLKAALVDFSNDYKVKGLQMIAINANDIENYPDDSPDKMIEDINHYGYSFPYLFDESQEIAKAYRAACTPDFFMYDAEHKLYYRGQFDDSRPNSDAIATGKDMRMAADALLSGQPAPIEQKPSLGCSIKWKAGNEPEYFS